MHGYFFIILFLKPLIWQSSIFHSLEQNLTENYSYYYETKNKTVVYLHHLELSFKIGMLVFRLIVILSFVPMEKNEFTIEILILEKLARFIYSKCIFRKSYSRRILVFMFLCKKSCSKSEKQNILPEHTIPLFRAERLRFFWSRALGRGRCYIEKEMGNAKF